MEIIKYWSFRRASYEIAIFVLFFSVQGFSQLHDNNILVQVENWDQETSIARLIDSPGEDTISYQEGLTKKFVFAVTNISMSDSSGNFIFCSNGLKVYNKKFEQMTNGDSLLIIDDYLHPAYYESSIIEGGHQISTLNAIPIPDHVNQYVFFYSTIYADYKTQYRFALRYVRVDMSTPDSIGQVVEKNVLFNTNSTEMPSIIKHANGKDWWIITADSKSDTFFVYLLNQKGLLGPKTVVAGSKPNQSDLDQRLLFRFHRLTCSPNGNILISQKDESVDIFSFDRCRGDLKFKYTVDQFPQLINDFDQKGGVFTGQFSSNSQYYYYTQGRNYFQLDLGNTIDIPLPIKIGQITINTDAGYMRRLPSGKLALFRNTNINNASLLTMIAEPNIPGHHSRPLLDLFVTYPLPAPVFDMGYVPEQPNYRLGKESGYSLDSCSELFFVAELTDSIPFFVNGKQYQKLFRPFKK